MSDDEKPRVLGACLRGAAGVGAITALVLAAMSPVIAHGVHAPSVAPVLCLAALVFVNFLLVTFHGSLQARNRYGFFAASRVVESLIVVAGGYALVRGGAGAAGALGGYVAGMLTLCLFFFSRRSWYAAPAGVQALRDGLRGLGRPLAVVATLLLVCNLPVVIARSRLTAEQAGDIGALFALRYTVLVFAEAVVWPLYTRTIAGARDEEAPRIATLLVFALGLGFTAVGVLVPRQFFHLFFGAVYVNAAAHMAMYGCYLTLHMVCMVRMFDDAATGRLKPVVLLLPVAVVASLLLWPDPSVGSMIEVQCGAWLIYLAGSAVTGGGRER